MELHLTDMEMTVDVANLGWKMKQSVLMILNLGCLLDIRWSAQNTPFRWRGEIWAGDR